MSGMIRLKWYSWSSWTIPTQFVDECATINVWDMKFILWMWKFDNDNCSFFVQSPL
jgi:hypothetical protein